MQNSCSEQLKQARENKPLTSVSKSLSTEDDVDDEEIGGTKMPEHNIKSVAS